MESITFSIVDDDLVERTEVVQLLLTTLTPGMILVDPNSAVVAIIDNDSKIPFLLSTFTTSIVIILLYRCRVQVFNGVL